MMRINTIKNKLIIIIIIIVIIIIIRKINNLVKILIGLRRYN
jgi:hypothetical protein